MKGRCLAKIGRCEEAAAAFEAATTIGDEVGLYLHELLALAELQSFVGEREGGLSRMKQVALKMLGPTPTVAQWESLGKAQLPSGVTWGAIMAAV